MFVICPLGLVRSLPLGSFVIPDMDNMMSEHSDDGRLEGFLPTSCSRPGQIPRCIIDGHCIVYVCVRARTCAHVVPGQRGLFDRPGMGRGPTSTTELAGVKIGAHGDLLGDWLGVSSEITKTVYAAMKEGFGSLDIDLI